MQCACKLCTYKRMGQVEVGRYSTKYLTRLFVIILVDLVVIQSDENW